MGEVNFLLLLRFALWYFIMPGERTTEKLWDSWPD